ncbi:MAG: hypothetical protein HOG49_01105 [Candidatus Scalindua sp.]|nr:hypothetical protein [Candidatus Scalindua sp.]
MIRVDVVLPKLPKDLGFSRRDMITLATPVKYNIYKDTASGVDYRGAAFAPYAPATPKSGSVDLRDTNKMLDSLTITAEKNKAQLRVGRHTSIASKHISGGKRLPRRDFFGVSRKSIGIIIDRVLGVLDKKLRGE